MTDLHYAYSDESYYNIKRFRSICLLTCTENIRQEIEPEVAKIVQESGISEIKWERIKSHRYFKLAEEIVNLLVNRASNEALRIDVLIWDIEDSRHKIKGRDDIANLERMYYHLLKTVLRHRWPVDLYWKWYPDEHGSIDWPTLKGFLNRGSIQHHFHQDIATRNDVLFQAVEEYHIVELSPCSSINTPMVQVADLFAGIGAFSHQKYDEFEQWSRDQQDKNDLFGFDDLPRINLSNAELYRCQLLSSLNYNCKNRKLQVSLQSHRGLRTKNPNKPVSFWLWEPQHEMDQAPLKSLF